MKKRVQTTPKTVFAFGSLFNAAKKLRAGFSLVSLVVFMAFSQVAFAQYSNVTITGFNADEVANGSGSAPNASTTNSVDNSAGTTNGYAFIDGTYIFSCGSLETTGIWPSSNTIASTAATGLTYTIQSSIGNNTIRFPTTGVGAQSYNFGVSGGPNAATIYLLHTTGSGPLSPGCNITVKFADSSSQVWNSVAMGNWCTSGTTSTTAATTGSTAVTITTITTTEYYRVALPGTTCAAPGLCDYMEEMALPLLPANYYKPIAYININKTATSGVIDIFGMGIESPCTAPSAQPTALTATSTTIGSISASFTAASPAPSGGYLVVQYPHGATPTAPVVGTTYTAASALGSGTVVYVGTGTSFTSSGLLGNTTYDYYVYSYATGTTCGGPVYNTTSPLFNSLSTAACGSMSGTVPIGPGLPNTPAGGYTSLTNAIAYINANGIGGSTIFSLQSGYVSTVETFPLTFTFDGCINAANTLTIEPAAGATGLSIKSVAAGSEAIVFNGAQYVTIDGRPGGTGTSSSGTSGIGGSGGITGALSIIDTSLTAVSTIEFTGDAQHCNVKYCNIQGEETVTPAAPPTNATILFIEPTGTIGLNYNKVSYCDVHSSSTAYLPIIGIGMQSVATIGANYDTLDHNNIYDYQATTAVNTTGILCYTGANNICLTNNSIYETASRAMGANTQAFRFMWIAPNNAGSAVTTGSGYTITGNYLGGSTAQCGGTACTVSSTSTFRSVGMDMEFGNGTQTLISNNTIQNFSFTSTYATQGPPGIFTGIYVSYGNVAITNNTIGGSTANNINLVTSGNAAGCNGIVLSGGAAGYNIPINGNTINNFHVSSSTTADYTYMNGILVSAGSPNVQIKNNTISNLTNGLSTTTGATGTLFGIEVTGALPEVAINNNTLFNLYNNQLTVGTGTASGVMGILINSTSSTSDTINGNIIYSVSNTGTSTSLTYAPYIFGIMLSGNTTGSHVIAGNLVYDLDIPNWSPSGTTTGVPQIVGIAQQSGPATIYNNMVSLGVTTSGASVAKPIRYIGLNHNTGYVGYYWFNSVYIGGAETVATTGTIYTDAFNNGNASGSLDVRDNIFENVRTSTSSSYTNYAVGAPTAFPSSTVFNYNDYYYLNASNNYFYDNVGTAVGAWSNTWVSGDLNSQIGNPQFNAPTGAFTTSVPYNLDISATAATYVEQTGIAIAAVPNDIHGNVRASLTPTDIGADAGNFVSAIPTCSGTITAGTTTASTTAYPCPGGGSVSFSLSGATSNIGVIGISYQWYVRTPSGSGSFVAISGATGSTYTGTVTSSSDYECVMNCSAGGTSTSTPVTVTVPASLTLPYSQGFNSSPISAYCWSTQSATGNSTITIVSSGSYENTALSGTNSVAPSEGTDMVDFNGSSSSTGSQVITLVSPAFTTVGVTTSTLYYDWYQSYSYYQECCNPGYNNTVQLEYSLTGLPGSWVTIGSAVSNYNTNPGWYTQSVALPAGALGQTTVYFGFLFTAPTNADETPYDADAYLDNVKITVPCSGTPPVGVAGGFTPVAATGWNADVIANGSGTPASSITEDVDHVGYCFYDNTYTCPTCGYTTPAYSLPANGQIISGDITGLLYQLQSSSANNSLQLVVGGTATGTLTFPTPTSTPAVYLLATSGSGASTMTVQVNFSDTTATQTFTGLNVPDWFGGTPFAEGGFGRVQTSSGAFSGTSCPGGSPGGSIACPSGTPRMYDIEFALPSAYYNKHVSSLTITNTSSGGTSSADILNIFAVSTAVSAPAAFCGGLPTSITLFSPTVASTSTTGLSYQWESSTTSGGPYTPVTFGGSSGTTTTLTDTVSGTVYYVCQTTCANSGLSSLSNQVTENISPVPTISVSPTSATYCQGSTGITLTTTSTATSYSWSPSTGLSSASVASPVATPSATTTYTVTGYINACPATATTTITYAAAPVVTAISATPSSLCSGATTTLSVTYTGTASSITWSDSTGSTGTITTPNATSTTVTAPSNGINTYIVTLPNGTCTTTKTIKDTVGVTLSATASNSVTPATYCTPTWDIGSGDGDYIRTAVLNGTTNTTTATAYTNNAYNYVTTNTYGITAGTAYTLTGTIESDYNDIGFGEAMQAWIDYNNDGVFESNELLNTFTTTADETGTGNISYSLSFTVPTTALNTTTRLRIMLASELENTPPFAPCAGSSTYYYGQSQDYNVTISGGTSPNCGGTTTYNLSASGFGGGAPYTYAWSSSPSGFTSTAQNPSVSPTATTTYTVTVTDNCSNTATASTTVTVITTPAVTLSTGTYSIECGNAPVAVNVTSTLSNYATYVWSPSTGLYTNSGATTAYTSGSSATTLYANPSSTTTYTVTATMSGTGCSTTATANIYNVDNTVTVTQPTSCTPSSGIISVSAISGSVPSLVYQSNFASGNAGIATIGGTGAPSGDEITGGALQLTADVTSQNGYIHIPQTLNSNLMHAQFSLYIDQTIGNGADGISYSYGTGVAPTGPNYEDGFGYGLKICFMTYNHGTNDWLYTGQSGNVEGIYVQYGNPYTGQTTTGVVGYSSNTSWAGTTSNVVIDVNTAGQLTLTVGGTAIFTNLQLPAAYLTDSKVGWEHSIAARTGGVAENHTINNIYITEGVSAFTPQYSLNGTGWQDGNTFTGLSSGIYHVEVRDSANTSCVTTIATDTLAVPTLVAAPSITPTASGTYCTPTWDIGPMYGDYINTAVLNGVTNTTTSTTYTSSAYNYVTTNTYTVAAGSTYTLTGTIASDYTDLGGGEGLQAWIDYNHNGVFDAGESLNTFNTTADETSTGNISYSLSFTVPSTALTGTTRLRIMVASAYENTPPFAPCAGSSSYYYGQAEDFNVNITGGTNPLCGGLSSFLLSANASGGANSYTYSWTSNPAGFTSTAATATVAPLVSTTYTCRVTDTCGNVVVDSVNAAVLTSPTVTVNHPTANYCTGGSAVLDTASGAVSYAWSPSAGLSATVGSAVSASPTATTTYTVTGTASNGCYNTATSVITIQTPPILANPTASVNPVCPGSPTILSVVASRPPTAYCQPQNTSTCHTVDDLIIADSITSTQEINSPTPPTTTAPYYQDFGTTTGGTGAFVAGRSYHVTAADLGGCGNIYGGIGVWIDLNQDGVFENNEFMWGQANSASGTYAWSGYFDIPATALNGVTKIRVRGDWSETHNPGTTGSIWACNESNGGYGSTMDFTITITGGVNPTGVGFGYAWTPGAALSATNTDSVTATPSANTLYHVVVYDSTTGCTSTKNDTVRIYTLPTAVISGPAATCSGSPMTLSMALTGTAPWSYTIDTSGGHITGTTSTSPVTFTVTPSVNRIVRVTALSDAHCSAATIDSFAVNVNPLPSLVITNPAAGCIPGTVDITAASVTAGTTGASGFLYWNDSLTTSSLSSPNAIATSGVYWIEALSSAGCSVVRPVTVTINPSPAAYAANSGPYLPGQTISLSSGPNGETSYSWSGPDLFTAGTQNVSRSGASSVMGGTYTVTVTNSYGCSATASTAVVVNTLGAYTWTGATNTSWTTTTNWSPVAPVGGPSGCTENVVIPVVSNYPVISASTSIGNITVNSNAQLTLNASLSVCGNLAGGLTASGNVLGSAHLILTGTGGQQITNKFAVNYLEIDNSSLGVVNTGNIMVNNALIMTKGNLNSNSGSITLASNASGDAYMDNFTSPTAGNYSGNLTVQRYISNTADGYRDLSSAVATSISNLNSAYPVTGQNNVACYYAYTPYPNLQKFDESFLIPAANGSFNEHWLSYTAMSDPMSPMLGLAFRTYVGAPYTINMTGQPYNGPISAAITNTTTVAPANDGWNLLGNPYPSPVSWTAIKAMNAAVAGGSYYVYNTTGAYTGNWGSYNGTTGVNGATNYIASSQGFFIQTSSATGTFSMNNTVRTTTSGLYYAPAPVRLDNELRLVLGDGTNSDEIVTYTDANATNSYDAALDAVKMPAGSTVNIGYSIGGYDYAINVMNSINENTVLPLTIEVEQTGSYTLNAIMLNTPGLNAMLYDAQANTYTDLSAGPVQLQLNGGQQYTGRYSVVFKAGSTSGISTIAAGSTHIYSYGNTVYVERSSSSAATISITNVIGQNVANFNSNSTYNAYQMDAVQPWYAIVKVTEGEKVTVAKVILNDNQ